MGLGFVCRRLLAPLSRKITSSSPFVKIFSGQQHKSSHLLPLAQIFGYAVEFTTNASLSDTPSKSDKSLVQSCIPDEHDYDRWIVVVDFPENVSDSEKRRAFVRIAAKVLKSSEEEAKSKIYKMQTKLFHGFHIETSKEMIKLFDKEPKVAQVLPEFPLHR